VRDLPAPVKNKTKDGLSDGSIIWNNEKIHMKQRLKK
tara:strand:+ start:235 stop:345 length:111 start_codon:yes stop_codon:yes gene_type:complete